MPVGHRGVPEGGGAALRAGLETALCGLSAAAWPLLRPAVGAGWHDGWRDGAAGHYHSAPELFLQLSGWTRFHFPAGECLLQAGQALLLPPHLQHAERVGPDASGPFRNLVFYAERETFSAHLAHEARQRLPAIAHLEARKLADAHLMEAWLREASRSVDGLAPALDEARARGLVAATLAQALACLAGDAADAGQEPALVARVRVWVKNQLGDAALGVRGLARLAGVTPDYLSQQFRRHSGEALLAHITRLRMERAEQLLLSTDMAIKEVAWACGYNGAGYFIQAFRRRHGQTPAVWRETRAFMARRDR